MARYADRLLADGERVALRGRQHFLATIVDGRVAWAIFIASLLLVLLVTQLTSSTPDIVRQGFSWLGLILLVIGLLWLFQIYLAWYSQDYVITNRRVMKVEGILNKRSADSSLEKINDAVLEQNIFGRMLGFGDLDILTANEQSVDRYRMLSEAQTFKRTMLDQKHRLEQDAFQIPAPPLRVAVSPPSMTPATATATAATAPPEAAVPAPAPDAAGEPAPMEPAAPRVEGRLTPEAPRALTAEEITRAVGDLADLRDRGAISDEEFEAKKQELLGRL